jgi:hypothetical protein
VSDGLNHYLTSRKKLLRECIHCEIEFELNSPAKAKAGGKINECADCVEELGTETAVRYLGHSDSIAGEAADLGIIAFESDAARMEYAATKDDDINLPN